MKDRTMKAALFGLVLAAALVWPAGALAQYNGAPANGMMSKGDLPAGVQPADLQKIAFDQRLNAQIPLDLPFKDEAGRTVTLAQYFNHRKPVVLALVYYDCPMLCTLVLNGLAGAMKGMSLNPGSDYDLVTISFNPRDTPPLAAQKKKSYIQRYGHADAASAWHFLTGQDASIKPLADAVGFHYVYDETTGLYAHASGIMVATADGRLAKYLYGIDYAPRDLRLALVDASAGRIGTPVDRVLLYCYHYDPKTGKYGLVVLNVIRLGGIVTVVVLGSFIVAMVSRERKRTKTGEPPPNVPGSPATSRDQSGATTRPESVKHRTDR
jgi:protein SCO1